MKTKIHHLLIATSLSLAPLPLIAADAPNPGKASDGVRENAVRPEGTKPSGEVPVDPSREPGKTSDAPETPKAGTMHFKGKITSIDQSARTVTLQDKEMGPHTLHIGSTTTLRKGSDSASWSDLKVGEEVQGQCVKTGDQFHAQRLTIGGQ